MRLVTTVEYRREGREEEEVQATNHTSLALAGCGAGAEAGWCPVGPAYPHAAAARVEADCRQVVEAYRAVVTPDIDQLGDNSPRCPFLHFLFLLPLTADHTNLLVLRSSSVVIVTNKQYHHC